MSDDEAFEKMRELGEEVGPARAVYLHQIRTRVTVLILVMMTFTAVIGAYMYQNWTDSWTRDCRTYVSGNYNNVQAQYLESLGATVDQGIVTGSLEDDQLSEFRSYLGDDGKIRVAGEASRLAVTTCPTFFFPWDRPDRTPELSALASFTTTGS